MPRFQIKRKTRPEEKKVVPEEKVDEMEVSDYSDSESSDYSEPLTEQMETLEIAKQHAIRPTRQTEPQFEPQRRSREATVARRQPIPARNEYQRHPDPVREPRQLGQRRLMQYPKPSRVANGRRALHYRSYYGPDSTYMTTQDKARRLYNSCFG